MISRKSFTLQDGSFRQKNISIFTISTYIGLSGKYLPNKITGRTKDLLALRNNPFHVIPQILQVIRFQRQYNLNFLIIFYFQRKSVEIRKRFIVWNLFNPTNPFLKKFHPQNICLEIGTGNKNISRRTIILYKETNYEQKN